MRIYRWIILLQKELGKNQITILNETWRRWGGGDKATKGTRFVADFIEGFLKVYPKSIKNIMEIGCCYGYNLNYLIDRFGEKEDIHAYGVDSSDKAIEYGRVKWNNCSNIHLSCSCSNSLPFGEDEFDIVMVGFCLYVTPREWIQDSVTEINRVLKRGGFLVITDFDTPLWYKRVNRHNDKMPVFKENYAKRFIDIGYTLVEKVSYSHEHNTFARDIQERVSTQVLYKELEEDLYIKAY